LGADVNAKDNEGQTPLHNATYLNYDAEVVKYLVSVGANVQAKDDRGETPLDVAKHRGSPAVVKVLSGLK
jgi:ankyrin repeat protein